MGYTIYYNVKPSVSKKAYTAALEKINLMVYKYTQDHRGTDFSLSGYSAHSKTYSGVQFNGARDEACEAFCLPQHNNLKDFFSRGLHFVKTNRRNYSPVVIAACLLLRKELKNKFSASTDDGELENDEFYNQGINILMQYHRWAEKEKPIIKKKKVA